MGLIGRWGIERRPSIGGRSYSLDKCVYSALIIVLAGTCAVVALGIAMGRRDRALFILSGIGFVALVAACFAYEGNLH